MQRKGGKGEIPAFNHGNQLPLQRLGVGGRNAILNCNVKFGAVAILIGQKRMQAGPNKLAYIEHIRAEDSERRAAR